MPKRSDHDRLRNVQGSPVMQQHEKELEALAASQDGQAVQRMLEKNGDRLTRAFQTGDAAAMQEALRQLSSSESGARVIREIQRMLKK